MGCGESKHDVATGNTLTRKKSNAGEQSKKSKDIRTVLENASLLVQQQEEGDQSVNNNNNNNNEVAEADHHVKDIAENPEMKGGEDSNGSNNKAQESLITKESPNRYFSSRKEEESIDGIEGSSEKSEYDSPRPEVAGNKESLFNDNEAAEEKKLAEETIPETKNAEGVISEKTVEDMAKETEKETAAAAIEVEASVSAPAASAEKNFDNADKEQGQLLASPSKDLKTV